MASLFVRTRVEAGLCFVGDGVFLTDPVSSLYFVQMTAGGTGSAGIPKTESMDTLDSVPYAARYLDCTKDVDCRKLGYNSVCWINRTDVEPVTTQQKVMGGRAKYVATANRVLGNEEKQTKRLGRNSHCFTLLISLLGGTLVTTIISSRQGS